MHGIHVTSWVGSLAYSSDAPVFMTTWMPSMLGNLEHALDLTGLLAGCSDRLDAIGDCFVGVPSLRLWTDVAVAWYVTLFGRPSLPAFRKAKS